MDRIEPRIHDEIKDYKEKFYNFTLRQWIFGILIVITTVPLYLLLSPKLGSDITGWIVILIAIPIGFFGFIPIQGLNAEKIIFFWKRNYINFAKPLLYKTEDELLQEKNKTVKTPSKTISKKEIKSNKKAEKLRLKELKKERNKQRELARAKKKFGINQQVNSNGSFSLSPEEKQVLLKLAQQVVDGKEDKTINEEIQESEESSPNEEKKEANKEE